jgi:hypothetical protein
MQWPGASVEQLLSVEALRSPLSSRPEKSWVVGQAFGPPKPMTNGSCSATTVPGGTIHPFVISTGAPKERSREICGPAVVPWNVFGLYLTIIIHIVERRSGRLSSQISPGLT